MAKMTITKPFDFPFRRIGQKNEGEPYYAVGTLRMEPLPTEAVEYAVDMPDAAFARPVMPSFAEAVGAGIKECAQENEIVGLRVTLIAIEANEIGSSDYWFHAAAHSTLEDAIKAHGAFANPITILEAFDFPFRYVTTERFAVGTLRLEPTPNHFFEYAVALPNEPPDEALPEWCQPFPGAVEKGIRLAARSIGLAGVRVTLTRLLWHDVNSSTWSYETAGNKALRAAIETHGVPMPAEETAQDGESAQYSRKTQGSNEVLITPKRAGHTKESLRYVLVMLVGSLISGSVTAYEWHTRLQSGYYYPKLSFFATAFAFGFAVLFIVGILFPEQTTARPLSRSPEEMQARIKATQWKLGAFFAVCLLAGLLNLILLDR